MSRVRPALSVGLLLCGLTISPTGIATADPAVPAPDPGTPGTATPVAAPLPAIDDGLYTVGTDIAPGVYATAGPTEGGTCYWRRIGADDVTLANALTKQPQVVAIEAADTAFKTRGCQPWRLTDESAAPTDQVPPLLSQLQLRHNLDILNGLAGQSGNGQLPPY